MTVGEEFVDSPEYAAWKERVASEHEELLAVIERILHEHRAKFPAEVDALTRIAGTDGPVAVPNEARPCAEEILHRVTLLQHEQRQRT